MTNSPSNAPAQSADSIAVFIDRWQKSAAAERANYQGFLSELCDVLGVARPDPTVPNDAHNAYVFERSVTFHNVDGSTSIGRIDLYKRGTFVLEAKQGSEQTVKDEFQLTAADSKTPKAKKGTAVRGTKGWDDAMFKARGQAEQYAKALPTEEGWPPFLIVVDVGHSIHLFADFTRSGKTYLPFPDPGTHRIKLENLGDEEVLNLLRTVWTDPLSLDPSRRSAKVTRELAERLARLAKSLEGTKDADGRKLEPKRVADFLMRCLFTMFAEDVELLDKGSFTTLLESLQDDVAAFPDMVRSLWESMDKGTFSPIIRKKVRQFNGGLFEDCEALPLKADQIKLLIEAARSNWREVEPAIFGTLLERALDPIERHKLGAHYTPRAYVERLVMPTIIEPLREEWDAVRAAAVTLANRGDKAAAIEEVRGFLARLCDIHVLDPACGSGNFLYVALEHMKRIEGEILNTLRDLGGQLVEVHTVDPHQFLGIEVNPRAAAIADLVLWIGYLQWHIRTRSLSDIHEPIIRKFHNIECRDAVLAWDSVEPVLDEHGRPVTRWDGRTMKKHPVTGEDVPDESVRVPVVKYLNPRKADWPDTQYVVGNPPFLGKLHLLTTLGEDYMLALRATYAGNVPDGADYVMYWWQRVADCVKRTSIVRGGLITTNSITQTFSRRIVASAIETDPRCHLVFAIPDHPWVTNEDGAAVRIAMTVLAPGAGDGRLMLSRREALGADGSVDVEFNVLHGSIQQDLRIGAAIANAQVMKANATLASTGLIPGSRGFVLSSEDATRLRGTAGGNTLIHAFRNGRDITDEPRDAYVIDTHGMTDEALRTTAPAIYQWLYDRVFPERQSNRDPRLRKNWWLFRRSNEQVRAAISGLRRFIVTPETAKFRNFVFLDAQYRPEHRLVVTGTDDAMILGVMSSRVHIVWALESGGTLEDRPVYNKSRCFDCFPFPSPTLDQASRIRSLGEQLDLHRKSQQSLHPGLTMTGMYNVLEKLRSGEALTAKEKVIHEQGLVSVLKQLHDDLDAAVFDAYGWPATLTDEEILERLVALNAERAAEEQQGLIRWLRPEFQNPSAGQKTQARMEFAEPEEPDDEGEDTPTTDKKKKKTGKSAHPTAVKKVPWPKTLPEQIQGVRQHLQSATKPVSPPDLAQLYARANVERIQEVLDSLVIIGTARQVPDGKFVAS